MAEEQKEREKKKPQSRMLKKALDDPVKFVTGLVTRTESAMSPRAQMWRRYRSKYRIGLKYLSAGQPQDVFVPNYIYSNVEAVKAHISKNMPEINVEGGESSDLTAANLLGELLVTSLVRGGLEEAQAKVVHHGAITGMAWFKVWFDPDANDGLGDNVVTAIPPEDMLVDPLAVPFYDHNGKTTARYFIHRRRDVSIDEILATYDVKIEDLIDTESEDGHMPLETDGDYIANDVRQKPYGDAKNTGDRTFDVYECWIRTYEPLEIDEETGEVVTSPWYIITVAGNAVLEEKYSPYHHGEQVFEPWFDGEDDGAADLYHVGVGEVEPIEAMQDKATILDLNIFRNIKLVVNRQRFVNRLSGLSKDNISNREGEVYEVNGNPREAVLWDTPPMLGNDVYTYRQQTDLLIQIVSGVTDVMGGRKPTGIAAAKAMSQLMESSSIRIANKQQSLIRSIRRVAIKAIKNIFQFYTTERVIRTVSGADTRVIGEYPPELQPGYQPPPNPMMVPENPVVPGMVGEQLLGAEGVPPMEVDPLVAGTDMQPPPLEAGPELDEMRARWRADNGIDLVLEDVDWHYDIKVTEGSPLPANKEAFAELAMHYFRIGLIDRQAALEAVQWPNHQEILDRMAQQGMTGPDAQAQASARGDIMAQMMQQAMAQQQGGMM